MNYVDFLSKYKNLIYAPLEFEIPNFNVNSIISWAFENQTEVQYEVYRNSRIKFANSSNIKTKEEWYKERSNDFWETYYVRWQQKWLANFENRFPEFVSMSKELPLNSLGTTGFIYQNQNKSQTDVSQLHTDEKEGFGIRLVLGNDISGLHFHKLKNGRSMKETNFNGFVKCDSNEELERDSTGAIVKDRKYIINSDFFELDKIYVNHPSQNAQLFLITNDIAAHAVDKITGDRITFAWFGKTEAGQRFNWEALDLLLNKSYAAYPEHFIYA